MQIFNDWVLAMGDGKLPAIAKESEEDPTWIKILEEFLILSQGNPIKEIVNSMYPNFMTSSQNVT